LLSAAFIAVAMIVARPPAAATQPRELPAQLVTMSGRVELSRRSAPNWTAATLRDELSFGDGARTVAGRAALLTKSGQALRVGPRTQIFFATGEPPGDVTRVRMDGGRLWVAVLPNGPAVEVRAGPATVTTRAGGAGITMNPDGSVIVSVYHGAASVTGDGWQRALGQDQEVVVLAGVPPKEIVSVKRERRDPEWIKWNEQQDQAGGYGARVQK